MMLILLLLFCMANAEYRVLNTTEINADHRTYVSVEAIYVSERFHIVGNTTDITIWIRLRCAPKELVGVTVRTREFEDVKDVLDALRLALIQKTNDLISTLVDYPKCPPFIELTDDLQLYMESDQVVLKLNLEVLEGVWLTASLRAFLNFRDTWLSGSKNVGLPIHQNKLLYIFDNNNRLLTLLPIESRTNWRQAPFSNEYTNIKSVHFRNELGDLITDLPKPWLLVLNYESVRR